MKSLYSGLIDYWPLHEQGATRFSITGQNNLTGTAEGIGSTEGRVLRAARFVTADAKALFHADSDALSTGDISFSWCCWVNMRAVTTLSDIIAKDNNSGTGREYELQFVNGTPDEFWFRVYKTGPAAVNAVSSVAPVQDQWHFIVAGHDAAANLVWIDVDRTYDSTATGGALQAQGAASLYFGGKSDNTSYVQADLCEVGFWKRVLTPAERAWLHNGGRGRTYPFDGRPSLITPSARQRRNRATGQVG